MVWFASTTTVIYNLILNCQYGSHRDLLIHFMLFVGEADNEHNFFFIYFFSISTFQFIFRKMVQHMFNCFHGVVTQM